MIGINFGEDGGNVAAMEKKFGVTWRSFSNLDDALPPDLVDDLDLQAAGYMMLIDSKGIIRYKGSELAFASKLDTELEALVQEAETAAKPTESNKTGGKKEE